MEIKPENEVRLYKNVPFFIDYKDIILFDDSAKQKEYFSSLTSYPILNVTYTRDSGAIKVAGEKDFFLDYNYMSFTNHNYTNKTFYAFITGVEYVNPNTTLIRFVIDEWQTWCFDLEFRESFIERKHCKRWNSDGTPVINTQDEGLDIGNEYIVKYHEQYNNELYWLCFVTSLESSDIVSYVYKPTDIPSELVTFYIPIYKTTNNVITNWEYNGLEMSKIDRLLSLFRSDVNLVKKLVSLFIVENPPFEFTYNIINNKIDITTSSSNSDVLKFYDSNKNVINAGVLYGGSSNPTSVNRTFSKYGNLIQNVTESKLLMYPYSFVSLIDGQGSRFDIKLEYLNDTNINVRTFTSGGLNAKQAHIVQNYRYKGLQLNYCRWELGNGIINSSPNNLTIVDDYSAAYLQGNANQLNQSVTDVLNQTNMNNRTANITRNAGAFGNLLQGVATIFAGAMSGAVKGGLSGGAVGATAGGVGAGAGALAGAGIGGIIGGVQAVGNFSQNVASNTGYVLNTELQGNLNNEKAMAGVLAKKQDINNVADNVALQGGDVYFTYQNQYAGYCLVYKQISDEYIKILESYFKKYGYAYNKIEIPNLHTRKSWDYIRTIDVNIKANINNNSLEKIKTMFNQGVTIWHTTDVSNFSLNNDEI